MLWCVHKYGVFADKLGEKIKQEILQSELFKFDWYIASRTPQELTRRINTLLLALSRDSEAAAGKKKGKNANRQDSMEPSTQESTPVPNGIEGVGKRQFNGVESASLKKVKVENEQ